MARGDGGPWFRSGATRRPLSASCATYWIAASTTQGGTHRQADQLRAGCPTGTSEQRARRHKHLKNRAENSHLPTRKRERVLQRFKSAEHARRSSVRPVPSAITSAHADTVSPLPPTDRSVLSDTASLQKIPEAAGVLRHAGPSIHYRGGRRAS